MVGAVGRRQYNDKRKWYDNEAPDRPLTTERDPGPTTNSAAQITQDIPNTFPDLVYNNFGYSTNCKM